MNAQNALNWNVNDWASSQSRLTKLPKNKRTDKLDQVEIWISVENIEKPLFALKEKSWNQKGPNEAE